MILRLLCFYRSISIWVVGNFFFFFLFFFIGGGGGGGGGGITLALSRNVIINFECFFPKQISTIQGLHR